MIRIITIEREYGCGGAEIARKLSDRLGWKLWDQLLTNEIARLCKCGPETLGEREERTDPLYYRLFKAFLRGSFEGSLNVPRLNMLDADKIVQITEQVVQGAAAEGNCVIVGRGSQHFLRDRRDALRVFLYATQEEKVRRLMARGKSQSEAEDLVEHVDRERADFIDKYFHVDWPSRAVYHAMLNTAAGDETVIQMILNLAEGLRASAG